MKRRTFVLAGLAAGLNFGGKAVADKPYVDGPVRDALYADPQGFFPQHYAEMRSRFRHDLPIGFNTLPEPAVKLAFSSVMAFLLKPYGPSNPLALADCLRAPDMNCDNYCVFSYELYRILQPRGGPEPTLIGWNGGAIGNHSQLLLSIENHHLLCDPTIGMVARGVTLNSLCRGTAPNPERFKSFFDQAGDRSNIANFNRSVLDALMNGKFMAGDILYYFPSVPAYLASSASSNWATPQSWNM